MKKKIAVIALVACVLAVAIAGATIAYFTDTKQATNVFTAGDVKITFTELDAKGVEQNVTGENFRIDYGTAYPGRVVTKKPTVTLNTGSEDAYVAAKIILSNKSTALENSMASILTTAGETGKTPVIEMFDGGAVNGGATILKSETTADGDVILYVIVAEKLTNSAPNGNSALLFENFIFPADWDSAEIAKCGSLEVSIQVYATQATGFTSADEAMLASFPDSFKILKP